ncbi:MAG: CDP-alcohol phosphatidyltransferase family protein [Candidatus Lokiarchaeota archaeon]|nr:CDP-alcohol phosphatidyltransferase family protein [Candidatus Lokiarchaeota archaeon]
MASKFRLRRLFKPIINLLARALSKIGLSANGATITMLSCSIISFLLLVFFSNYVFFSIFVFLTGIFDGIDGAIARLRNKTSRFGGIFDSTMDRLSEFFIFLALLINRWDENLWNFIDMKLIITLSYLTSIMISYSRSRAQILYDGDFDIGLMARSERLFYIFVTTLISFYFGYFNEYILFFLLLTITTAIFRFLKIHSMILNSEKN